MGKKRADVVLVERGLFDSRAKARAAIEAGGVSVAGRVLSKPSELIDEDGEIAALPAHPYVGRGALKLVHALDLWPVQVEDRTVLDVGASTGGFTEVCLQRGRRPGLRYRRRPRPVASEAGGRPARRGT